ncbi:hypothetical protein [Herpetosiphon geysericola]|uniref:Uncharacterized protein n=1 Tax=Herpetosiphon geysericola TaxID=70996 RepID=A0A0P6XEI3_9CHLR|nr:hypothetical protein [Herpetosiphon geysericola]KPL81526.1 hypothetical protein SE18_23200 [Herpetosiphon geysericola]
MAAWLKMTLWSLFIVVVSCSLAVGFVVYSFNRMFGRNTPEKARLAPIIIDEPIGDCSISPARNFVLATAFKDGVGSQKIYNLKTGDEVAYPDHPEADIYGNNSYGNALGWINDPTQDIALVSPYWLVNFTTGEVTKVELSVEQQSTDWWEPLLMPDYQDFSVKSPDQRYVADSGRIYRATTGKLSISDLVVSFSDSYPEVCTNPWEPDSSGYYFIDGSSRADMSGPLRFLKNPER